MPSFDVVSEVDMQEVRNAVDQARRELANRFDFKGTDCSIELTDDEIELAARSARIGSRPLRQVLEEKLVKRKVSLKALDYGKVEEAAEGTASARRSRSQAGISATRPASSASSSRASASRASSTRRRAISCGSPARSATTCRR